MPNCGKKHTPIESEAQRGFFGAVLSGKASAPGLSKAEARSHLEEVKGKKLPARKRKLHSWAKDIKE